ncbi:glutamate racemase [Gallaecimonas xiamenensis]|uniref:Glutamate racemase n=1 Tax=Gallaecimonas xiamenensis 3-C-1 TaxID=745411 RepID=K2K3T7_9GAMM|nr:glutamate racemase [Gallaecimonas xiamenensis]EKE77599.1 glutamate racemase [Gallaecimonas xiamenensis 3-C-1]
MSQLLFFDSGVGGLSVWQEVHHSLPQWQAIYAMDDAAFPYGELTESVLVARVLAVFEEIAARHPIALAVVACNTASTLVLPELRARFDFPIVGVVPAIKPAALQTRSGKIGLLATPGTVNRPYTRQLEADFAKDKTVLRLGSSELVIMAEAKLRGEPVDMARLEGVLAPWLNGHGPDTVILGCTHFPLLKEELAQVLGNGVILVDSGQAIARRVASLLPQATGNKKGGLSHLYHTAEDPKGLALLRRWLQPGAVPEFLPLHSSS